MNTTEELIKEIEARKNPEQGALLQRFFKTGKGDYGEGDKFLGLKVPNVRAIAQRYRDKLTVADLETLLNNHWHEVRLAALVVMVGQFAKADSAKQEQLYNLYISQIGKGINNWDLVDISCPRVVGAYLFDKDRQVLYQLAGDSLWQKRVSIISTFYFLRENDIKDTYDLAERLVYEEHDLLHKAVGWSLREMGKVDIGLLETFLNKYAATMPRTALRYALEKMSPSQKSYYMGLKDENKTKSKN